MSFTSLCKIGKPLKFRHLSVRNLVPDPKVSQKMPTAGADPGPNIEIHLATEDDAAELFAICSEAFGSEDPAWKAYYPLHWTPEGRKAGSERFSSAMQEDHHAVYHKAVDVTCGTIVAFSIWTVYNARPLQYPPDLPSPDYWPNALEAEYGHAIMLDLMRKRHDHIKSVANSIVHLNTLAVLPAYQRRGIATRLMEWGVDMADQLGFPCFVEATPAGRPLYQRCGFVIEEEVLPVMPTKFADREPCRYTFMTRRRPTTSQAATA